MSRKKYRFTIIKPKGSPVEINERSEPILADDYPVYVSYWYVLDNEPKRSDIEGTVRDLKRDTGAKEIRRCAAIKRGLL